MKNFKLICKDINGKTHEPEFDTRLEAEEMQARILDKNEWNFATKEVLVPSWQETIPAKPEVLDDFGNVLEPAIPEHIIVHPDELKQVPDATFEIIDNTIANEAEKAKETQKKSDRNDRVVNLKAIDWSKNLSNVQMQTILKALVEDNLKDEV